MRHPSTAEIATEVDRLVIGVHRSVMARHRPQLQELVEPLGLDSPGHLIDLAEFVIVGRCTPEIADARFPYDRAKVVRTLFDQLHKLRLLGHEATPSDDLVGVVDAVVRFRAEAAISLWGNELDVAQTGASEALGHASGDLVDSFRSLPEPVQPAHRLHHVLTGLRYARLDAHVAAWTAADLSATEIVALSAGVDGKPLVLAPKRLVKKRWLTDKGEATPAGESARSAIETATNQRGDAMFNAVTNQQRWYATLRSLSS